MRNSTNGWKTRSMAFVAAVLILAVPLLTIGMARNTEAASTFADFNGDGYRDLAIGVPQEDIGSEADAGAVNVIYGSSSGLSASGGPGDQVWTQDSAGISDIAEAADRFGHALATGDFNNDNYTDLAVGIPGEDIGAVNGAGAVQIIYGSSSGLSESVLGDDHISQNNAGVEDTEETDDAFGFALTTGDFNNDGYDDLAVGVREESAGAVSDAGAVNIFYGTSSGLCTFSCTPISQLWHQDSSGIEDTAESSDFFGSALAAGDFNNDGYEDLAIGVEEESTTASDAGAVNVIYGSSTGLSSNGDQFLAQGDISDTAEADDEFGFALAAGDFNNDGYYDLAVGVHDEDIGALDSAGAVNVIYGSSTGLSAVAGPGGQFWHQDSTGIPETAAANDNFGESLTVGDFNNDGYDDLAIGVPGEDGAIASSGHIHMLPGSSTGLSSTGDQDWNQGDADVEGTEDNGDEFGSALAAGDFNNDGYDDLAIGVPEEDFLDLSDNEIIWIGAVNILYGSSSYLSPTSVADQLWQPDSTDIEETGEPQDRFGDALASG